MARLIDAHPDFRPRAWLDELPPLDAFGTLVFQVLGQQLSVAATRAILSRLVENFGGRLPSPAELLGADAQVLQGSGMSARKVATLRAIAGLWTGAWKCRTACGNCSASSTQPRGQVTMLARLTREELEAVGGVGKDD